MGMLTDLCVAEPPDGLSDEKHHIAGAPLASRFERVEFKGLADLEFSTLAKWLLKILDIPLIGPPTPHTGS